MDPNEANQYTIPVTIYTGSIELIKQDSVSASISSGDASLAGAKFLIQKEDGTFSETVTIPESLSVSISGLGAGTYTIREVKAGEGYQLNKKDRNHRFRCEQLSNSYSIL